MITITSFDRKYDRDFLSNFYPCKIESKMIPVLAEQNPNLTFRSAECAYQCAKCANVSDMKIFETLSPGQSKRHGRKIEIRTDWNEIKIDIMESILKIKFSDEKLKNKLISTGNAELIEGNNWHDNFWGFCHCSSCADVIHTNNLGNLLMKIRNELTNQANILL